MSDHDNVARSSNLSHGSKPIAKDFKLPIRPMEVSGTVTKTFPVSKITSGIIRRRSISIPNAIVAYLDILGFSEKKYQRDIRDTLLDFAGPITSAMDERPRLRATVFSDCAFVSASKEDAADLLSVLRYAFVSWAADGIPVRGGIAVGKYMETQTYYLDRARENFISRLFHGSAVTSAVRVEQSGEAALLFASEPCARFYQQAHREPIYDLGGAKILGWSDEPRALYWFAGVSFVRILRLLSLKETQTHSVITRLWNNVRYSMTVNPGMTWFVISVILSSPVASNTIRSTLHASLGVEIPPDSKLERIARDWVKKNRDALRFLVAIADMDSSITQRFWKRRAKNRLAQQSPPLS